MKSSHTGKLCSWCSGPCCFGHAVLVALCLHRWLFLHHRNTPCPAACSTAITGGPNPVWDLPTLGPLSVTNRDFPWYIFPLKCSLCGAFRCSSLERCHLDSLLWKQDLTVLVTSASVLLVCQDKVACFVPAGSASPMDWFHQTYPCPHLRWAVAQTLRELLHGNTISKWSLLPLDSSKQPLKLLESFQLEAEELIQTLIYSSGASSWFSCILPAFNCIPPSSAHNTSMGEGERKLKYKAAWKIWNGRRRRCSLPLALPLLWERVTGSRAAVRHATDLQPQPLFFPVNLMSQGKRETMLRSR